MNASFMGLGIRRSRMAANLIKSNSHFTIYNRTISKAVHLKEMGAKGADNYVDAVSNADIVIAMLGNPKIVDTVKEELSPL